MRARVVSALAGVAILVVACSPEPPPSSSRTPPLAASSVSPSHEVPEPAVDLPAEGEGMWVASQTPFFVACPIERGMVRLTEDVAEDAATAYLASSGRERERLLDPAAAANGVAGSGGGSGRMRVLDVRRSTNDPIVRHACGRGTASKTWRVTVDDGTISASMDFWLFVVGRRDGAKVWAKY
jgi:hypothetical protein